VAAAADKELERAAAQADAMAGSHSYGEEKVSSTTKKHHEVRLGGVRSVDPFANHEGRGKARREAKRKVLEKAASEAVKTAMREVEKSAAGEGVPMTHDEALHVVEDAAGKLRESSVLVLLQQRSLQTGKKSIPTSSTSVANRMLKEMAHRAKKWQNKAKSIPSVAKMPASKIKEAGAMSKAADKADDALRASAGIADKAKQELQRSLEDDNAMWGLHTAVPEVPKSHEQLKPQPFVPSSSPSGFRSGNEQKIAVIKRTMRSSKPQGQKVAQIKDVVTNVASPVHKKIVAIRRALHSGRSKAQVVQEIKRVVTAGIGATPGQSTRDNRRGGTRGEDDQRDHSGEDNDKSRSGDKRSPKFPTFPKDFPDDKSEIKEAHKRALERARHKMMEVARDSVRKTSARLQAQAMKAGLKQPQAHGVATSAVLHAATSYRASHGLD